MSASLGAYQEIWLGRHYNGEGKITLYGMESEEYRRFVAGEDGVKLLTAFRNKRSG